MEAQDFGWNQRAWNKLALPPEHHSRFDGTVKEFGCSQSSSPRITFPNEEQSVGRGQSLMSQVV
jgi:hypothetical protein